MMVPLCRCNRCLTLMVDNNPQSGCHRFEVPDNMPENIQKEESWACPECGSDQYLSDVGCMINYKRVELSDSDEISILTDILKWVEKGIQDSKKVWDFESKKLFVHFKKFIIERIAEKS